MELREEISKAVKIAQEQYAKNPTKEKAKLLNDFLAFLERIDNAPQKARLDILDEQLQGFISRMSIVENALPMKIRRIEGQKSQITRMGR